MLKKFQPFNENNVPYNIASYFYIICNECGGDYATNVIHILFYLEERSIYESFRYIL